MPFGSRVPRWEARDVDAARRALQLVTDHAMIRESTPKGSIKVKGRVSVEHAEFLLDAKTNHGRTYNETIAIAMDLLITIATEKAAGREIHIIHGDTRYRLEVTWP